MESGQRIVHSHVTDGASEARLVSCICIEGERYQVFESVFLQPIRYLWVQEACLWPALGHLQACQHSHAHDTGLESHMSSETRTDQSSYH